MQERKIRLYLESSLIIMLGGDQDPVKRAISEEFFHRVAKKSDKYELLVSPVTIEELNAGIEKHGDGAVLFLNSLVHTRLQENDQAEKLAVVYIDNGVLSNDHLNDLRHSAYAVFVGCDYIVTWNMKHLAKERTVTRINTVNLNENHGKIFITTPDFFTRDETDGQ